MLKGFIKIAVIIVMIIGGFMPASSQKVYQMTAQQAVDYALKNSIQVRNALLDIKVQQATNKEITASAFPQINGTGNIGFNPNVAVATFPNFIAAATYGVLVANGVKDKNGNTIVAPSDFGFIQAGFGSKYSTSVGVDLNQLLFDGQVFVGLMARKTSIDFARKNVEVTQEQIKTNIYKIYYQLVVGKKQIESIGANISRFEKLLHDTKEISKNGFAEKLDVDKVDVQLNNLKTEKIKADNQLDAGNEGLKFLMNLPQKDVLILTDSLSVDQIKANIMDTSYDYANRKEYQQLLLVTKLNQYNIKRYQLSKVPTLALSANYNKNKQGQKLDLFNGPYFTSSFIGLRLSAPIFDGGARNARIERARLELQRSLNNMEQLKASVDNDISQSTLRIHSALITLENQQRNIVLAEQVYNTTKLKYEQGLGSNQEIYTAQTELQVAQNNYYSSLYDAINAKIDFLKAAGKL
ncbi:MAG: TolC family protein [Ginsengibacter sp.]